MVMEDWSTGTVRQQQDFVCRDMDEREEIA